MMKNEFNKFYLSDETPEHVLELLENGEGIAFTYNGSDYYLENYTGKGWIITEPQSYFDAGWFAENPPIKYPYCGDANTIEAIANLPFLDVKSLFDRFNEIDFFEF
jgi:hypothetical protein